MRFAPLARHAAALGLAAVGAGCVMVPRTAETYDPECRIRTRQMELQPVQIGSLMGCHNQGCAALLVAAGADAAASAVVSGSIVIAGNVVYWFEKQGRCNPAPAP